MIGSDRPGANNYTVPGRATGVLAWVGSLIALARRLEGNCEHKKEAFAR
jgi:hypothetical protein